MNRFISTISAALFSTCVCFSTLPITSASSNSFADVKGYWAESQINQAVTKGYAEGYPDGTFRPDNSISRAEFIKMLVTSLYKDKVTSGGDNWFAVYVSKTGKEGIHKNSDFTTGDWDTPITRNELARLTVRAASGDNNTNDLEWMYLATKTGLIQGTDDTGTLGMDEPTTRAQSVTIIERVLSVKKGEKLEVDKHAVSRAEVEWHGTNVFTMWPRYFPEKYAEKFNISKGQWNSPDGIYHEKVLGYIVVDMEDPNDPFRSEVSGMKFTFKGLDASGNPTKPKNYAAPTKSYVAFSKVSQVLTESYPSDWYAAEGGGVDLLGGTMGPTKDRNSWMQQYSSQENESTVLFTKNQEGQNTVDVNKARGNPRDQHKFVIGKEYYWYSAKLFPKGDSFTEDSIEISFAPSIYYWKNSGAKGNMLEFSMVTSFPNFSVSNP